jgi:hypothetical protein
MYDGNVMSFNKAAQDLNNLTYTDYYCRLMLLARSVFAWDGLPPGLDEKWIERYFYHHGKAMFFKDKTFGYVVSQFSDDGMLNIYDEPTHITPVANDSSSVIFNKLDIRPYKVGAECVLMRNNDIAFPTKSTIKLYALRLAEIQRTIDININAQKTPTLITGSEKQMKSLKTVYKQWNGNEPVIYADKSLELDSINVLKTDAPIAFDKLQIQKHAVWNEVMTFLGINNANMDKRERLVAGEVQSNNEQIELSAHCMLKARETACKQINDLFNLNVSVRMRKPAELNIESVKEGILND